MSRDRSGTGSSGNTAVQTASTSAVLVSPRCLTRYVMSSASRRRAARAFMARGWSGGGAGGGGDAQAGVVEDVRSVLVAAPGGVGTRLLIEPPAGQPQFIRDCPGFFE